MEKRRLKWLIYSLIGVFLLLNAALPRTEVNAAAKKVSVKSAYFQIPKYDIFIGEKLQTKVTYVLNKGSLNPQITYLSSNPKVASIDSNGLITGLSAGGVTITAKIDTIKYTLPIVVRSNISNFEAGLKSKYMKVNEKQKLDVKYTLLTKITPQPQAVFSSGDVSIAAVDKVGNVSAMKVGVTNITVSLSNFNKIVPVFVYDSKSDRDGDGITDNDEINKYYTDPENKLSTPTAYKDLDAAIYPKFIKIKELKRINVKYTSLYKDSPAPKIVFKCENPLIATVSADGSVTGVKAGYTNITISLGGMSKTLPIYVYDGTSDADGDKITDSDEINKYYTDPADKLSCPKLIVDLASKFIKLNEHKKINAKFMVYYRIITDSSITYKSENPSIALVDKDGTITGTAVGYTNITAVTGNLSKSIPVYVYDEKSDIDGDGISDNDEINTYYTNPEDKLSNPKVYKSSNNEKDYASINAATPGKLTVRGRTLKNYKELWVMITNEKGETPIDTFVQIDENGNYSTEITENLPSGKYKISLLGSANSSFFYGICSDIQSYKQNDGLVFSGSQIYGNNLNNFYGNGNSADLYLKSRMSNEEDKDVISKLANEIAGEKRSDYEKILAVHDWVTDNIYYDFDAYLSGVYGATDAIDTLKAKRSVCAGYADLTAALIRSLNIPCKIVNGYALGYGTEGKSWGDVDHSTSNHAWNEALVDGRWIIIDTTWDSRNTYKDGHFQAGDRRYTYFDPTLEVFSNDHKIMDYEEY